MVRGFQKWLSPETYFVANVRDHRWLPVARSVPVERSGTSTERDAGSHSVDRIVGLFVYFSDETNLLVLSGRISNSKARTLMGVRTNIARPISNLIFAVAL